MFFIRSPFQQRPLHVSSMVGLYQTRLTVFSFAWQQLHIEVWKWKGSKCYWIKKQIELVHPFIFS